MATTKSETIREVLAARDEARLQIYDKASQLNNRAEVIKDIGYDRPLNAQELADLKKINAALGALYSAENDLMLITVTALDRSDETKRFVNVVTAANVDLKSKMENVARVAQQVKELGDMFSKITSVITSLTKLLAF
jgi:hypothetical protein